MKRACWGILGTVVLALLLMDQRPAQAGVVTGTVSLDTSTLSGPFELAFVFIDGSGTGDGNNTVTLGNFLFGGGSAGAVDTGLSTGGVSGDLTSGASLVDSSFFNVFASSFTPGSLLSFDFSLTTNVDGGGAPDQLSLVLLQADGITPVATEDPSGGDSLLTVNIDSASPAFSTFASDLTSAPIVTTSAVPEPPTLLLLAIGLLSVGWATRTHRPDRSGVNDRFRT